jgi:hypothetical protein
MLLCGGETDRVRILETGSIAQARTPSSDGEVDRFLKLPIRWSQGFQLGGPGSDPLHPRPMGRLSSPDTFGHNGSNCCIAWADPSRQLVCASLTNLLPGGLESSPHQSDVSDAVLAACHGQRGATPDQPSAGPPPRLSTSPTRSGMRCGRGERHGAHRRKLLAVVWPDGQEHITRRRKRVLNRSRFARCSWPARRGGLGLRSANGFEVSSGMWATSSMPGRYWLMSTVVISRGIRQWFVPLQPEGSLVQVDAVDHAGLGPAVGPDRVSHGLSLLIGARLELDQQVGVLGVVVIAGGGHVELGAGVLQAASAASGSSGRVGICAFHGFKVVP